MFRAIRLIRSFLFAIAFAGLAGNSLASDGGKESNILPLEMITTNLKPDGPQDSRYLQAAISLKMADPKDAEAVKAYMPELRHEILLVLCGHTASSLLSSGEGREVLADEIQDALNGVLGTPGKTDKNGKRKPASGPVTRVLFTAFTIQ